MKPFGLALAALIVFVVGVQVGMAVERSRAIAPVVLTSAPCIEDRTALCFVDRAGHEVRVRVRGNEATPYLAHNLSLGATP